MPKKKYSAEDLEEFIDEQTTSDITCTKCGATDTKFDEAYYVKDDFYKKGWRVIDDENVYCPRCVKKKSIKDAQTRNKNRR